MLTSATSHSVRSAAATGYADLDILDLGLDGTPSANVTGHPASDASNDLETLVRAWINEKGAPEVLEFAHLAVEGVLGRIDAQVRPPYASFAFADRR
jgi:hypothetical protein